MIVPPFIQLEYDAHKPDLPTWGDGADRGTMARIERELPGLMERNGYGEHFARLFHWPATGMCAFAHSTEEIDCNAISPHQISGRNNDTSEGRNAAYRDPRGQKRAFPDRMSDPQSNSGEKHAEFADQGAEISTISPRMDSYTTQDEKRGVSPHAPLEPFDLYRVLVVLSRPAGVDPMLWLFYQAERHGARRVCFVGMRPTGKLKRFCRRRGLEICCE